MSCLDKLADVRENHVEQMRKYIESVQAERSHTRGAGRPFQQCKMNLNSKKCEAIELGHLIQIISEHQLNEDETWNQCLRSISQTLKGIDDLYFDSNHAQCSWVPGVHGIADSNLNFEGLKLSDFPSRSMRRT
jgi:acetoin utilization deacetylase AcuC-like enzyme